MSAVIDLATFRASRAVTVTRPGPPVRGLPPLFWPGLTCLYAAGLLYALGQEMLRGWR
jgi:hypothetical protein